MPASTKRATSIYGAPVVAKRPSGGVSRKPKPANASAQPRAWDDSTRGDRVSDEAPRPGGKSAAPSAVSNTAVMRRRAASSIPARPLGASNSGPATSAAPPAAGSGAAAKKRTASSAPVPTREKRNPKTFLSKGEYGKLIGVGPRQRRADRVHVDLALLKKDDTSKTYDALAELESGARPGAALGAAFRGGGGGDDASERDGFADESLRDGVEASGAHESAHESASRQKSATAYAPSIRFSKNPKYRTVTSDGVFVAPPDMSGEPPAPGSAADRAAHPPKPPKSTGDERLDRKRARLKSERERRAAETLASKKAASKARREASAAAASVGVAELTFFKDTVRRMAEKYNALKSEHDTKASELAKLVTDFAERDAKLSAQVNDTLSLRGGGGALFGKPVSRSAAGANPRADLKLEELRVRVADAERNAEDERFKTATLGHMILRLRESDPTTEARRRDPHASLATTRETAVAAASGTVESAVPWVGRKLELVKRFQADVEAAIEAERARSYAAANEESQARSMLARAIASAQERREAYEAQLGQRRMTLVALRAEDEAMAARKESFINRLAQMNKELADEERDRKRGGKAALPGFSGGVAKAFITAMTGGALRTREAKTDAAIRKLVAVIPDVTPEGLVEGFKTRKQRKTLTRDTSRARQATHDALVRRRDELLEELARTKEELYNADDSLDDDVATRASRGERPEDRADDGVFMAEHATRATRLTLGNKEKDLATLATGVMNLSDAVARFDETLERTLRGWSAARDDAREALELKIVAENENENDRTSAEPRETPTRREAIDDVEADADADADASASDAKASSIALGDDVRASSSVRASTAPEDDGATDLMNATARRGMAYLETFYDALERANVVALADLHRERTLAAAREQGVHPSKVIVSSLDLERGAHPAVPALSALRRDSLGEKKKTLSAEASRGGGPRREGSSKSVTLLLFDEDERFEVDSVHDDVHDAGFSRPSSPGAPLSRDVSLESGTPAGEKGAPRRDSSEAKTGSGPASIARRLSAHNTRIDVTAGSEEEARDEDEDEDEDEDKDDDEDSSESVDPRLSRKSASVVLFRKGLKKGESAAWARETEARMTRRKTGPRAKPAVKRRASSEVEAVVSSRSLGDAPGAPDAAAA